MEGGAVDTRIKAENTGNIQLTDVADHDAESQASSQESNEYLARSANYGQSAIELCHSKSVADMDCISGFIYALLVEGDDAAMEDVEEWDYPSTTDDEDDDESENMSSVNDYTDVEPVLDIEPISARRVHQPGSVSEYQPQAQQSVSGARLESRESFNIKKEDSASTMDGVQELEHWGDILLRNWQDNNEYEDDEAKDIFDDGLEDDDNDSFEDVPNDTASIRDHNYEALSDLDSNMKLPRRDPGRFVYDDGSDLEGLRFSRTPEYEAPVRIAHAERTMPMTFHELEKERLKLLYNPTKFTVRPQYPYSDDNDPKSLQEDCDAVKWRIIEMEEIRDRIHVELDTLQRKLIVAEARKRAAYSLSDENLRDAGISLRLQIEYEAFCNSLDPEFGQRGGFDIVCDADHQGSYVQYDPDFAVFKESVEMSYAHCKFRCEAFQEVRSSPDNTAIEYVVEFWPVKASELLIGASSWGEQYYELYNLAEEAVIAGRKAALEMLIALPDQNARCSGGWMCEYVFEEALSKQPIVGKRWRFKSAHNIDHPCTAEEKKKRLRQDFRPRGSWR